MKKSILLLALFSFILILTSCGSTNNIADYDMTEKTFYFENFVDNNLSTVRIYSSDDKPRKKKDEKDANFFEVFTDIANIVGTAIITNQTANKVEDAVHPDSVVNYISYEMENTLIKFLNIKPAHEITPDCQFIVTTVLKDCALVSAENGSTFVKVSASVQIIDRKTGGIVWQNSEDENVMLRYSTGGRRTYKTLSNAIYLAQLASLSEDEISNSVYSATSEVGRSMGETFRKDFYEVVRSRMKK